MTRNEYQNRDYSFSEIEEDPRFAVCFREMIISYAVFFLYLILMMIAAYRGSAVSPEATKFICGMPSAWFSCLVILAAFIVITWFVVKKVFRDMDLSDQGTIAKRGK